MGVQNLLPLLSPISKLVHLSSFAGKRMAIDGFVWLHRASFRCAKELVDDPGTEHILPYVMGLLKKVISCGITPVVVFDGQQLPQKLNTNKKRHQERMEARAKAIELEANGFKEQAYSYYQKAVEITSATVFTWVQKLRDSNIEYIVAPYEADAELSFLCRNHYVDCVLTEDSDLLPYQTPITLFKLDSINLTVVMIKFEDILPHLQLTINQFIGLCCFSGCDYLDHINKLGIQTSLKYLRAYGDPFEMLKNLKSAGKYFIPEDFEVQLKKSMLTYQAQRVYDPRIKQLVTLSPINSDQLDISTNDTDFLGPEIAPDLLQQIVSCEVDTRTYIKLRTEAPTGPISPYFKKKATPINNQNKEQSHDDQNLTYLPPKSSSSKYFQNYKDYQSDFPDRRTMQGKSVKSYLQLSNPGH